MIKSLRGLRATACFLLFLLGAQAHSYWVDRSLNTPNPIEVGEPLPLKVKVVAGSPPAGLACRIAFVFDPDCPFSRQLAQKISSSSLPLEDEPVWLSVSSVEQTKQFAKQFTVANVYRFAVPRNTSPSTLQRYIDISVIPTRLVFNEYAEVIDIRITESLARPPGSGSCELIRAITYRETS